jgi:hypothetical protein
MSIRALGLWSCARKRMQTTPSRCACLKCYSLACAALLLRVWGAPWYSSTALLLVPAAFLVPSFALYCLPMLAWHGCPLQSPTAP